MEKYCKSCGGVFDNLNFKLCPYCGRELATRYGRQPIPRKLRHEVFKRDGYRCRECGASKDETSLEIDHIVPVARGGTNDISNLQTLCRECNRMKHTDEWVGGETDLEIAENELRNLEDRLKKEEERLNIVKGDEKLDCEFNIKKLNEDITKVQIKIMYLTELQELLVKKQKFKTVKEKAFKRLYLDLDEKAIKHLASYLNILNIKNEVIRYGIDSVIDDYIFNDYYNDFSLDADFIEDLCSDPSESITEYITVESCYDAIKHHLSKEKFNSELEELRKSYGDVGFMDDIDFARMILSQYDSKENNKIGRFVPISYLQEGFIDISIIGRVQMIFDVKTDESRILGEFNGLLLSDNKSMVKVNCWTSYSFDDIHIGDILQINHVKIKSSSVKDIYEPKVLNQNYDFCKNFYHVNNDIKAEVNGYLNIKRLDVKYPNYDYIREYHLYTDEIKYPNYENIIEGIYSIIDYPIKYEKKKSPIDEVVVEEPDDEIVEERKEIAFEELISDNIDDLCRIYSIPKLGKTYVINKIMNDYTYEDVVSKLKEYK